MTIYHWINVGMMRTKNIDLLEKVSRAPRMPGRHGQENKHKLGFSIEARPKYIEDRAEFRHWEIDTVLGIKGEDDAVLMTLAARKTRFECIIKVDRKDTSSISKAVQSLAARTGTDMRALFKTITSDNGSEFSTLEMNLKETTQVYFSHPYAAYERGTSENQHKLIQRLIPKSQPISTVSAQDTLRVQKWMNTYPRKQLNYRTSQDALMAEIKQIVYKSVKSPHRGEEMPFIHSQSLHTGDWINGKLKLEIRVKYIKPIVHKHLPFVDSFL